MFLPIVSRVPGSVSVATRPASKRRSGEPLSTRTVLSPTACPAVLRNSPDSSPTSSVPPDEIPAVVALLAVWPVRSSDTLSLCE